MRSSPFIVLPTLLSISSFNVALFIRFRKQWNGSSNFDFIYTLFVFCVQYFFLNKKWKNNIRKSQFYLPLSGELWSFWTNRHLLSTEEEKQPTVFWLTILFNKKILNKFGHRNSCFHSHKYLIMAITAILNKFRCVEE